jgi:hypothetical protein
MELSEMTKNNELTNILNEIFIRWDDESDLNTLISEDFQVSAENKELIKSTIEDLESVIQTLKKLEQK